jgi:hypothetical protein
MNVAQQTDHWPAIPAQGNVLLVAGKYFSV